MIGFYNISVWLTYFGLASAVFGMTLGIRGEFTWAVICLIVSNICDMFDGKIARATKRSDDAKAFGIQIDSLCDLVCFGAFPAMLCYCAGVKSWHGVAVLILYVLAGVIRLAFYNVTEAKRQQETTENRRFYQGLPITSIGALLTLTWAFKGLIGAAFPSVLECLMLFTGLMFVLNVRIPKPQGKIVYVFAGVLVAAVVCLLLFA